MCAPAILKDREVKGPPVSCFHQALTDLLIILNSCLKLYQCVELFSSYRTAFHEMELSSSIYDQLTHLSGRQSDGQIVSLW